VARDLLQHLSGLLNDCDINASQVIQELRPIFESSPEASRYHRLERLVDAFEFEDALTLVQQWLEELLPDPANR